MRRLRNSLDLTAYWARGGVLLPPNLEPVITAVPVITSALVGSPVTYSAATAIRADTISYEVLVGGVSKGASTPY